MGNLTMGSLFDGSGGFPLGALLEGITPVWASEIEPFPIRVTTKRLPQVKHYGNICEMDGGKIEAVDIVTFGSPCTNMSVAGRREGLNGKQSVLFYEAIRVIKEMRCATNGQSPRFIVFENVPGMFSSGRGLDFKEVLSEIVKIKDETLSVPMPEKSKWLTAGEIVGNGFSIAYRTIDAQFWGTAQRRRRCYLIADFASECAGKILFEFESLSGYTPQGFGAGQGTAANAEGGVGTSGGIVLNDQGGGFMDISEDVTGTLRAEEHGHQPIVFEPGAASRLGGHAWDDSTGSLRAEMGDNQLCVAVENHPTDSRVRIDDSGKVQTLTSRMGTGGGNVPLVASFMGGQGSEAGSIAYSETVAPTLRGQAGGNSVPMVMNERQYALTVGEDVANTLSATDYKGTQCVFEPVPQTLKIRSGKEGGGKGALVQEDKSATLSCNNDQTLFVPKAYGICSDASNAMRSGNPDSGIYEADTSRTLDGNGGNPACNQGGMAVVALQGSMIGRDDKNGPQGTGVNDDVCFTLNTIDKHAVAYSLDRSSYNQGKNAQFDISIQEEQSQTLVAKGPNAVALPNLDAEYIVRRLTPTECALLQGFPPTWCENLETSEPTEADIAWWSEVFETHRGIMGTSNKPKSRKQIIKWLQNPHSDAAEYKMWGNGVALPCVRFVMAGIVWAARNGL